MVTRYVNRPNCLPVKEQGDLSAQKERELLGKLRQRVEDLNSILLHGCKEYEHTNYLSFGLHGCNHVRSQLSIFPTRADDEQIVPVRFPACRLSGQIEYFCTDALKVVRTTYRDIVEERDIVLDIIKKSQQHKKYERSWGKVQKDKTFTLNAKQKILESGAVVDRHCGTKNSFEVTLTVPGSGWDVYDVVSRYSGYMVNRLTQIIRRAEKKGCKLHWFFVWEHQQRGALHMHWCIACEDSWAVANLIGLELRSKWWVLLEELSEKTLIDLFKKRGFSGTWRHCPEIWQSRVTRVRKSVAAYFSKYCSKNAESFRTIERRRAHEERKSNLNPDLADSARVYSLSPTRYWGSSRRTKRLCAEYRVRISFDVASPREGDFIRKAIHEWLINLCPALKEVSRGFKKVASDTGFIYCSGWEYKAWFKADVMLLVRSLFHVIKDNVKRKTDAIGAICDLRDLLHTPELNSQIKRV